MLQVANITCSGPHKGPPAKDCSSFRGVGLSERSATEITLFTLEERRRAREMRLKESRPGLQGPLKPSKLVARMASRVLSTSDFKTLRAYDR